MNLNIDNVIANFPACKRVVYSDIAGFIKKNMGLNRGANMTRDQFKACEVVDHLDSLGPLRERDQVVSGAGLDLIEKTIINSRNAKKGEIL